MDELKNKVNKYINNELLDFDNFPETSLDKNNFKQEVLKRLFLKKYSKKAQYDAAKELTEERVDNILNRIYHSSFVFVLVDINTFGALHTQNQIGLKFSQLNF